MNKKFFAVILAIVLIFGAVMLISGCNKDDENTILPNESTNAIGETEQPSEEPSTKETENTSGEKETEKQTENKSEPDEIQTESPTKPTETTTEKDEPVTCDNCGNVILSDSYSGDLTIGNYCDGRCDEWFGELEL